MLTLLQTRTDHPGRFFRQDLPQIFDLLQLSKKERECREKFLALKQELQRPKFTEKHFAHIDETILRRKAWNAALYYRFVRRERMRLFRDYIDRLPTHDSVAA